METGFVALVAVVALAVGGVIGLLIGKRLEYKRYLKETKYTQGTLNVDCIDPETQPTMFLGLWVPIDEVTTRRYVALDVNVITRNSQK